MLSEGMSGERGAGSAGRGTASWTTAVLCRVEILHLPEAIFAIPDGIPLAKWYVYNHALYHILR